MTLDTVLRRAIRRAPCTIRALARQAGVSHAVLAAIVTGEERATPRVAQLVARALERWGTRCHSEAARVRTAVADHRPRRTK
jgi:lambda repressor-like predicted transcriptional regulator